MASIARATERIIQRRPFLQEALSQGIINYVALAESIKEEIEHDAGKKVAIPAIVMALRRLSEKLHVEFLDTIKFGKDTDMTLQSELFEITVVKSSTIFQTLKGLYDHIDFEKGDFLTITQGIHQVTIISNKRYKKIIAAALKKEKIIKEIDQLASLTIKIPLSAIDSVGLFFMATRALAWENIPIVEIVSTLTELTIIIKEPYLMHAYHCMKQLINAS